LGPLVVSQLRPADILTVLRSVECRGRHESARRLRSTIGTVIRYAIATGRAEHDPTSVLRGALVTPVTKSRAAITDARGVGALLRAIDGFEGQPTTRAALRLSALLFPRPGELRVAEWKEFDLDSGVWVIPAPRTKMRRIVPPSRRRFERTPADQRKRNPCFSICAYNAAANIGKHIECRVAASRVRER
jgi:integrase